MTDPYLEKALAHAKQKRQNYVPKVASNLLTKKADDDILEKKRAYVKDYAMLTHKPVSKMKSFEIEKLYNYLVSVRSKLSSVCSFPKKAIIDILKKRFPNLKEYVFFVDGSNKLFLDAIVKYNGYVFVIQFNAKSGDESYQKDQRDKFRRAFGSNKVEYFQLTENNTKDKTTGELVRSFFKFVTKTTKYQKDLRTT